VLQWVVPDLLTKLDARRHVRAPLCSALSAAAEAVLIPHLPSFAHPSIARQVNKGVTAALRHLLLTTKSSEFSTYWYIAERTLPRYWEPPTAANEPPLPAHQLQALRWTASLIALEVRNRIEDLHAQFTSDSMMPALNRALRNTAYQELLAYPAAAWRLSMAPRVYLELRARGLPVVVPPVAG
jgi:hypothetical protein